MKLSFVAMAAVVALSGPAFAQRLNGGATLGQSQPGATAGVPYPNPAATGEPNPEATERTAPDEGSGAKPQGAAPPKTHKNSSKTSGMKISARKTVPSKDKVTPTNSPSPGASSPH
jgi:hypothetical protein